MAHPEVRDEQRLTAKGRATRDRIVQAAAELIVHEGLAASNMERVRKAASVSGSQLAHYFTDKSALIRAVVRQSTRTRGDDVRQPGRGPCVKQERRDHRSSSRPSSASGSTSRAGAISLTGESCFACSAALPWQRGDGDPAYNVTWASPSFAARREPPGNGCIRRRKGNGRAFSRDDVCRPYDGRRSDCPDGGVRAEHSSAVRVSGGSAVGS